MINGKYLIKRRETGSGGPPVFLSAGQLAFNKVNETLYVGTTGTIVAIGGSGSFVTNTLLQNLSANWEEAYTNLVKNSADYINIIPLDAGYF